MFVKDFQTIKDMANGEPYIKERAKQFFSGKNIVEDVKTHWIFFVLMIGFFLAGIFISATYYENKANTFIVDKFETFNCFPKNNNESISDFHPSISIFPTPDG